MLIESKVAPLEKCKVGGGAWFSFLMFSGICNSWIFDFSEDSQPYLLSRFLCLSTVREAEKYQFVLEATWENPFLFPI